MNRTRDFPLVLCFCYHMNTMNQKETDYILGMMNALQGKMWDMPILAKYAKQIKL